MPLSGLRRTAWLARHSPSWLAGWLSDRHPGWLARCSQTWLAGLPFSGLVPFQLPLSLIPPPGLERLASAIQPRYRAMVLVMAWGTLRIGEASGLRRSDVDLDAGTIRIENNAVQVLGRPLEGPPKTKAGRRSMTLPPSVLTTSARIWIVSLAANTSSGQAVNDQFLQTTGGPIPGDAPYSLRN